MRFSCVVLMIFLLPVHAQSAFKDWEWGSRAAGMGSAFCALADDASAPFYNPAGIAQTKKTEISFMYAKPYLGLENVDLGLFYAGYVHRVSKKAAIAVTVTDYSAAGLYRENVALLTAAANVSRSHYPEICLGIAAKYLSHQYSWESDPEFYADAKAYGDPVVGAGRGRAQVTADAGVLVRTSRYFSFGWSARNLTRPDVGLYYPDPVPLEARAGSCYRFSRQFLLALDVSYRDQAWGDADDKVNVFLGGEWRSRSKNYALRFGGNRYEASAGAGFIRFTGDDTEIRLDYALIWSLNVGDNIGSHRIDLSFRY